MAEGFGIPALLDDTGPDGRISLEKMMLISKEFGSAYRKHFESFGPRHRNAARWMWDLNWTIDRRALDDYLAPEWKH